MTEVAPPPTAAALDSETQRLRELGYPQELERRLHIFDNVAVGFAAVSPVVGLYAVVLVGTLVAGPAWVRVLPVALAGQCLLVAVYSELASEFPIAGGAYQWTKRLVGGSYGWFTGWVAVCAYAVANTTVAYLGAPWALALLGIEITANALVLTGMVLVLACAAADAFGIRLLSRAIKVGIAAEALATVGVGIALLLVFREQDFSLLSETLGRRGSPAARSARDCWLRWRSAAGCSSASMPASRPPRRRETPADMCPGRSGLPSSVSACWCSSTRSRSCSRTPTRPRSWRATTWIR